MAAENDVLNAAARGSNTDARAPVPSAEVIVPTRLFQPGRSRLIFIRPRRVTLGWAEVFGFLILGLVFAARFIPAARFLPGWGCPFRELTGGWPCASCGMTRSFDWFAQGRFIDSLVINPLGFFLALTAALTVAYACLAPFRPPRPRLTLSPSATLALRIGGFAALAGNWAYLLIRHALLPQA